MKKILSVLSVIFFSVAFGQSNFLLPIDSSGYYKLIDEKGNSKSNWVKLDEVKYDHSLQLFQAKLNGKWGVVDTNLSFVIFPKYDTIYKSYPFIYGETLGKLDVYSDSLKLFKSISDFERIEFAEIQIDGIPDLYCIVHTYEKTFVTNADFEFNPKHGYDDAFFYEGIVFTRLGDRYGFESSTDSIIAPVFTSIAKFNRQVIELTDENSHRHYYLTDGRKIPDTDSTLQYETRNGLFKIYKNGKGFLYTSDLELLVNYQGDDIFCIYDQRYYSKRNEKDLFAFKRDGKIGLINSNGNVIIAPTYQHIIGAGENRFIVMLDGKFGVIDLATNWIIEPVYTYIDAEINGHFRVYDNSKKGLTDLNGKIIVPVQYAEVYSSLSGIVTLNANGYGYYTFMGEQILQNEWSKVHQHLNNCFEFVSGLNHCVVNTTGLLTPKNCEKIYVGSSTIKYYLPNKIVLCHFENGLITDTSFFERNPSIIITTDHPKPALNINDVEYELFHSQLNGKFGSIHKEGSDFGVLPTFDNVLHDHLSTLVNWSHHSTFQIDEFSFQTKEILQQFFPDNGSINEIFLAYLGAESIPNWHSTELDPVITTEQEFRYTSYNNYGAPQNEFMLSRNGFTSIGLETANVNFVEGQNLIDYRSFFMQLNSYHNLVINDPNEFSLLSRAPMIKATNTIWNVIEVLNDYKMRLVGKYNYYQELETGMAIFSTTGDHYGIYFIRDSIIAAENFVKIIPFMEGDIQYFNVCKLTEFQDGSSQFLWTIYNSSGQLLPEFYTGVKSIHSDYFIIDKNGNRFVTDQKGNIVYTFL